MEEMISIPIPGWFLRTDCQDREYSFTKVLFIIFLHFQLNTPYYFLQFAEYENDAQVGENFIDCKLGRPVGQPGKVCRFNVDLMGPMCTWQKDYGYDEGKPCVLLKLNKVRWLVN